MQLKRPKINDPGGSREWFGIVWKCQNVNVLPKDESRGGKGGGSWVLYVTGTIAGAETGMNLSEYQFKWEVFPLMGVYILIGVFAIPLMRGVIITYE